MPPTAGSKGAKGGGEKGSRGSSTAVAKKPKSLLMSIKILDVMRYVIGLICDLVRGKEALKKSNDYVKKLLGFVWPTFIGGNPEDREGRAEIILLLMLSVVRTALVDRSAHLVRQLTQAVYAKDKRAFMALLNTGILFALCGTMESVSSHCRDRLVILWRKKLTEKIHKIYYATMNYYYIGTTKKPRAIKDSDDIIVREVASLSGRLVSIITNLVGGVTPILWFTYRLSRDNSVWFAMIPHVYLLFAYEIAQRLLPKNIGVLWRDQKMAQGSYYKAVSRLQSNAEAVAALDGSEIESQLLQRSYDKVSGSALNLFKSKGLHDLIVKVAFTYGCKAWIQSFILYPILTRSRSNRSSTGSLMSTSGKSTELMIEMLIANGNLLRLHAVNQHIGRSAERLCGFISTLETLSEQHSSKDAASRIKDGTSISFSHVDIHTPNNDLLVKNLSFSLNQRESLLLTGHNGAGKSSIFRCLGGLWPTKTGYISKPGASVDGLCADIYYLPQKPYNVLGSLKDQLTYPAINATISDEELESLLSKLDLLHLLEDNETINWEERLSLGEQQRLAMARLFHHSPKFAILDECTSAVSHEVEKMLYEECAKRNIAYITICHRPALKAYHEKNLHLKGEGTGGDWEVHDLGKTSLGNQPHTEPKPKRVSKQVVVSSDRSKIQTRGFLSKIFKLLRIVLPGSRGAVVLLILTILSRTAMHEVRMVVTGKLIQAALKRNKAAFFKLALINVFQDLFAAILEAGAEYQQNRTGVIWQDSLMKYGKDLFLKNNAFYRVRNIDGRVKDPDTRMTQEVQDLSEHLSAILSRSIQPLANVCWLLYRMRSMASSEAMTPLLIYMAASSFIIRLCMPDHATLIKKEQQDEAKFRFVHNRLRNHCESVAFFGGGMREKEIADKALQNLIDQQMSARKKEGFFRWISLALMKDTEDYSNKIDTSGLVSLYVRLKMVTSNAASGAVDIQNAMQQSISVFVDSFIKLTGIYEHISKLSGSSTRVCELFDIMESLKAHVDNAEDADNITFTNTTVATPTGMLIASNINIEVQKGTSLLVTGPNGVGKTSFFRVLSGLWAADGVSKPVGGVSLVPQKLYMVTGSLAAQVVYPDSPANMNTAVEGRIMKALESVGISRLATRERIQLINVGKDDIVRLLPFKSRLEQDCRAVIRIVGDEKVEIRGSVSSCKSVIKEISDQGAKVTLLSDDPAGLSKVEPWQDVLSLGEQQRLGIARILYHTPPFAVLDECTDAVSADVERDLYHLIQKGGTTCITISKRLTLPEFHQQCLVLGANNESQWKLKDVNADDTDSE
eukprot:TRINITY_DN2395_c0_g1_i2.p1 TRINITY_DN2395_c0_g1~~TRINITY_DN2395_c0_g1_i2.p1  ORF type:complete len:1303 (+),score=257.75 TRINITY_DN2395_c0_g1_i2:40-3948(+)